MSTITIVANGKGGVAKTPTAVQVINLHQIAFGELPDIVDCDAPETQKLTRIFKPIAPAKVKSFKPFPATEEVMSSPDVMVSYWDDLGDSMTSGESVVIDLGANVGPGVMTWAKDSHMGRYVKDMDVRVLVPTLAEPNGISGALAMLRAAEEAFPTAKRALLLVEAAGPFAPYADNSEFRALSTLPGVSQITIKKCSSPLWPAAERLHMNWFDLLSKPPAEIATLLNITRVFAVDRGKRELAAWAKETLGRLGGFYNIAPDFFSTLGDEDEEIAVRVAPAATSAGAYKKSGK